MYVTEQRAGGDGGDEQQLCEHRHVDAELRGVAPLRVHGRVAEPASEHAEHHRHAGHARQHRRQTVAAAAAAKR